MESVASSFLLPNRLPLHADSGPSQEYLGQRLSFIKIMLIQGLIDQAYRWSHHRFCLRRLCLPASCSAEALRTQLEELAN